MILVVTVLYICGAVFPMSSFLDFSRGDDDQRTRIITCILVGLFWPLAALAVVGALVWQLITRNWK